MLPQVEEKGVLKRLSHRHQAILDFMVANPEIKLGEVAEQFGVTQAWLSTIIHSGLFQAELDSRRELLFHEAYLPLQCKLEALAHESIDVMRTKLKVVEDINVAQNAAEMALKTLGYASNNQPPVNQQNNYYMVDQNVLRDSREAIGAKTLEGEVHDSAVEVQTGGEHKES